MKVITQYLDFMNQNLFFYPENFREKTSASLVETVSDRICDAIVLLFLENSIKETLRIKNCIKRQEKKYFVGNHFNIADESGFTCLEYLDLRFQKFKWRYLYHNLGEYLNIHLDIQSFKEAKAIAQIINSLEY